MAQPGQDRTQGEKENAAGFRQLFNLTQSDSPTEFMHRERRVFSVPMMATTNWLRNVLGNSIGSIKLSQRHS
jgi:hypothetical protein